MEAKSATLVLSLVAVRSVTALANSAYETPSLRGSSPGTVVKDPDAVISFNAGDNANQEANVFTVNIDTVNVRNNFGVQAAGLGSYGPESEIGMFKNMLEKTGVETHSFNAVGQYNPSADSFEGGHPDEQKHRSSDYKYEQYQGYGTTSFPYGETRADPGAAHGTTSRPRRFTSVRRGPIAATYGTTSFPYGETSADQGAAHGTTSRPRRFISDRRGPIAAPYGTTSFPHREASADQVATTSIQYGEASADQDAAHGTTSRPYQNHRHNTTDATTAGPDYVRNFSDHVSHENDTTADPDYGRNFSDHVSRENDTTAGPDYGRNFSDHVSHENYTTTMYNESFDSYHANISASAP